MIIDNEIKMLFEICYLPISQQKQRLNGGDFLKVAFEIMDQCRKETTSVEKLRSASYTLVNCFNNLLNPKISEEECENMINMLVSNNPMIRQMIYNQ